MEIVINRNYGGFGLSYEAVRLYAVLKGVGLIVKQTEYGTEAYYFDRVSEETRFYDFDIDRTDPILVQVVKQLGEQAGERHFGSDLKVVTIPDDVEWTIEEYDGVEWIAEKHRTWG